MLGEALYRIAQLDPQLAMDTALAQPIGEAGSEMGKGLSMELQVISNLAYSDSEKAIEFLRYVEDPQNYRHINL